MSLHLLSKVWGARLEHAHPLVVVSQPRAPHVFLT